MADQFQIIDEPDDEAIPILVVERDSFGAWRDAQPAHLKAWITASGFAARDATTCLLPGADGRPARLLVGRGADTPDLWSLASLARTLPSGRYRFEGGAAATDAALGWALGAYTFDRYKARPGDCALLHWPGEADRSRVLALAEATAFARDLVNMPAGDLGPSQLAQAAVEMGEAAGAKVEVIAGEDLLTAGYPAIHAVGRAAADAPRLIDLRWGAADAPKLTLVGKGVTFDSGGLGIKPASGMKQMKKDMGGAATVLALARLVMAHALPVRLRVLIPAVENAISGNAYHPLDVIRTRSGTTVEIGHTDAEGRVILSDALTEASSETPDLLIDMATLTGAARVALGPELPALFANDDGLAEGLLAAGRAVDDPLWRLPLWDGYRKMIDGETADITNSSESPYGGAITAALFLRTFVGEGIPWAHIDTMAWNTRNRPGRPKGGEALGLRALFAYLEGRYGG